MSRHRFLSLVCFVLILLVGFGSSTPALAKPTPRLLTPPAQYSNLRGMEISIPAGVKTPSEELIWQRIADVKSGQNKELTELGRSQFRSGKASTMGLGPVYPITWYESISEYTSHSRWIVGATNFNNNYSQPTQVEVSVKGTVSSSFKGSWAAKKYIALTLDVSFSGSYEIGAKESVPTAAWTGAALFAAAWGVQRQGKIHWDWIDALGYHRGPVSNVSFFLLNLPVEPIFEPVEDICYSCRPKAPAW